MRFLVLLLALVALQVQALEKALYVEVKEFAHYPEISEKSYSKDLIKKWQNEKPSAHSLPVMTVEKDGTAYYPIQKNVESLLKKNSPFSFLYWHSRVDAYKGQLRLLTAESKAGGNGFLLNSLKSSAKAGAIVLLHSDMPQALSGALKKFGESFNGSIIVANSKTIQTLLKSEIFKKSGFALKQSLYSLKQKSDFYLAGRQTQLTATDMKVLSREAAALEKKLKSFKSFKKVATLYSQALLYKQRASQGNDLAKQFLAWQEVISLYQQALVKLNKSLFDETYAQVKGDVLKGLGHPDWKDLEELQKQGNLFRNFGQYKKSADAFDKGTKKLLVISDLLKKHLETLVEASYKSGDTASAQSYLKSLLQLKPELALTKGFAGHVHQNKLGMRFSFMSKGEYMMGSEANDFLKEYDELKHKVRFSRGFYMAQTEVTVAQWRQVMGETDASKAQKASFPMVNVSWEEAIVFCKKLSQMEGLTYRLPTEAEWEYACKAGQAARYSSGDDLDLRAFNVKESGRGGIWEAGRNGAANEWGLFDMHGNVWEWCADWSAPYDPSKIVNPTGITEEQAEEEEYESRVVRGGSWADGKVKARSSNRWEYSPYVRSELIGFRVVLELNK